MMNSLVSVVIFGTVFPTDHITCIDIYDGERGFYCSFFPQKPKKDDRKPQPSFSFMLKTIIPLFTVLLDTRLAPLMRSMHDCSCGSYQFCR